MESQSQYDKVYISMPRDFLAELDRVAREEHLTRSGLIREAIKLYMQLRERSPEPRFFTATEALRGRLAGVPEEELQRRIDSAVHQARTMKAP